MHPSLKGVQLEWLGGTIMNWGAWKHDYPQSTQVLEDESWKGLIPRQKVLEWTAKITPVLHLPGWVHDDRLPLNEEVIGVVLNGEARAYAFELLRSLGTLEDRLGGVPITLHTNVAANHVEVFTSGKRVLAQRTQWLGWMEFHPQTSVYSSSRTTSKAAPPS